MANHSAVDEIITIVGAGSIGVAWAVVFTTSGNEVVLYDPDANRLKCAESEFSGICEELHVCGLISVTPSDARSRLRFEQDLKTAVSGASYVQECAPERLPLKQELFASIGAFTSDNTIIASSSSAIPISSVVSGLPCRERSLLVHPLNPPYLLKVVEIVPSSYTSKKSLQRTERLIEKAGMEPLAIKEEVEGFLFNRLQGALLREAYCLVRDGVASVEQVDKAVSKGLGIRWSVLGVFETVDLNTRGGIESHAEKMGPAYQRMGAERGQDDPWTKDLVAKVAGERRALLPLEKWDEKVAWRNQRLMDIAVSRKDGAWK